MRKIAVIAGTPVDTRMGVEFIEGKNEAAGERAFEPIYLPAASDCDEQLLFQYGDEAAKRARLDEIFDSAIKDGVQDFFIYCNSLSGAFDFETYAAEKSDDVGLEIRVYTPLQVYRSLGRSYNCIGLLAAHNMSAHVIEEALMSGNPDIYVIGSGNMQLVRLIEEGANPAEIADSCAVKSLLTYIQASGAEALILGCTHFPYLKEEMEKLTDLKIIDPAEEMYRLIVIH
ncbi:MAG: aspartate/glutamate racemase family protein [Mogibacterium sp.]|nr:aspartate/glutamate racemase family protein [Mogibacterium sp.]